MKGISQELIKEIEEYFFNNKNNTSGQIAKKFGIKLWQADKVVAKIQVRKTCKHKKTEKRFIGYHFYLEKQAVFCVDCNKQLSETEYL